MKSRKYIKLIRNSLLFDYEYYRSCYLDLTGLNDRQLILHYVLHGGKEGRNFSPYFDSNYYLMMNQDVKENKLNPLLHYLVHGWKEGRRPNPFFDPTYYLKTNSDVKQANVEPLKHFISHGWKEQRNPSAEFDVKFYLESNQDVVGSGIEPLKHYLLYGQYENRQIVFHNDICSEVNLPGKEDLYKAWIRNNACTERDIKQLQHEIVQYPDQPKISVIMPCYNPEIKYLVSAIESLFSQVYTNWELCIADDASTNLEVHNYLKELSADSRIKVIYRSENGHISRATNSAVEIATGEYILFFDQDDLLTIDCLARIALHVLQTGNEVIYSDDDKIDINNRRYDPQFKPDWSPELLLNYMYFSHAFVVKRELYNQLGGFRVGYEGSQDYDFALRVTELTSKIGHIPFILYHWRALPGSTAMGGGEKNYSLINGLKAVQDAVVRRRINATAYQPEWAIKSNVGIFSLNYHFDHEPMVTLIIPTKDKVELLEICVSSILNKTTYTNYKILIIDNGSKESSTETYLSQIIKLDRVDVIRIESIDRKFNFSRINNIAVKHADTDYVLLLNNDTEVITPGWLTQMMGLVVKDGVGAVGAKLLYSNKLIQHAGIVHDFERGMCFGAFNGESYDSAGYLSYLVVNRNYSAVTAACLLIKKSIYLEMGGLDEQNFAVAYNDVDFCYRLTLNGFRNIYCADAILFHYESMTRGFVNNPLEEIKFHNKYINFYDKYYSQNLSKNSYRFEVNPFRTRDYHDKKIRLAMFSHNLNLEGAPNSMMELAIGLHNKQIGNISVFAPSNGPLFDLYQQNKIEVNLFSPPDLSTIDNLLSGFYKLVNLIKNYDVVYANTMELFYVIMAAKIAGVPSVWNIRESERFETYYDKFPKYIRQSALEAFGNPYAVVFVAKTTANEKLPLNFNNNFRVIHNGLNSERIEAMIKDYDRNKLRSELDIKPHELVILLPGTVCARKGQQDLVKAYSELPDSVKSQLKILIVGDRDSEYSQELHAIHEELPLEFSDNVLIVPETKEIYKYYFIADIFVCSSRVESFPRVILEAMYFGLPIITTPVFGIVEQVRQNVNALFYAPDEHSILAKHLLSLVEDEGLRKKLASNSKLIFKLITSYDEMVEKYFSVLVQASLVTESKTCSI
ncbi:MAG: glycosyltransferase [Neisseriaceae bacterium]|nr:MAG: glycosyltransferase [Neisseriaceae bacterium]